MDAADTLYTYIPTFRHCRIKVCDKILRFSGRRWTFTSRVTWKQWHCFCHTDCAQFPLFDDSSGMGESTGFMGDTSGKSFVRGIVKQINWAWFSQPREVKHGGSLPSHVWQAKKMWMTHTTTVPWLLRRAGCSVHVAVSKVLFFYSGLPVIQAALQWE